MTERITKDTKQHHCAFVTARRHEGHEVLGHEDHEGHEATPFCVRDRLATLSLKARYGAAEDHLAAQIARIVKTQRSAVHMVSA